jgi:ABC-type antimicrobial peptide transport system permease subunit
MKLLLNFLFYFRHAGKEAVRKKFGFCLAFLSCLIVVTIAAIIQTVLDHAPLIFLRLAEGSAGEIDILIEPEFERTYLNYTRMLEVVETSDRLTPRILFESAEADCIKSSCEIQEVEVVFIDTRKEDDIELGREYDYPPISKGKCYILSKLATALNVEVGDKFKINFKQTDWITEVYLRYDQKASRDVFDVNVFSFDYEVEVERIIDSIEGKFPDQSASTAVIMEISELFPFIQETFQKNLKSNQSSSFNVKGFISFLDQNTASDFSTEVIGSMPDPRLDTYMNSNYDSIQLEVSEYASNVLEELGFFPIDMDLPVLSNLRPLRFVQVFLGLVLNMILFILFLLSVILIYSLLMLSVETKTFELGVIRVMGLTKLGIVSLIFCQTMLFVLPSILIGILISYGINSYVSKAFEASLGVGYDPAPTPNAVGNAILVGFLMPIISSIFPLRAALMNDLSESLDVSHNKSKSIAIKIDVNNTTAKLTLISFGIVSVSFGVLVYYLLPLALLSFNIQLFLAIFFAILVAFLLGLVLLSLNVQYILEKIIVFIFFIWESSAIRMLIMKNLAAHRVRNRKTTIMYALGLGFILFLSVNYDLQVQNSKFRSLRNTGTRFGVFTAEYEEEALPYRVLENIASKYTDIIEDYGWISKPVDEILRDADDIVITNLGKIYEYVPNIVGVSPNLLDVVLKEFIVIEEEDDSGLTLSEQLYTPRGTQGAVLGTAFKDFLQIDINESSTFILHVYDPGNNIYREMRPIALLNSGSGFYVSKYPANSYQDILVSMPTFIDICKSEITSFDEIPLGKMVIKLKDESSSRIDDLYSELKDAINDTEDSWVFDYRDIEESEQESQQIMGTIFSLVTFVSMFLCFFSLVSSMTANIVEQHKEISVLRATGMTKFRLSMLYVYESFVLVFSSSLLGLFIGTAVAWTMVIQQTVFTDMPIPFTFPYAVFISVLIISVVFAFGSSLFPALKIMRKPISEIMRMTT